MSGRNRASAKAAGTRAESAVVDYLRTQLGTDLIERRAKSGRLDKGDIAGMRVQGQPLVIEVKDHATLQLATWLKETRVETVNAAALAGVCWHKRRGTSDPGQWYVTMTGADLIAIITGEWPGE